MKQRIGVVGNRVGFSYEYVERELDKLIDVKDDVTLISGGADGVDFYAEQYAQRKGLRILIIYPDLTKGISSQKFFDRNKKIVDECDFLIAFNKKDRGGTVNTINEAKRQNKAVFLRKGDDKLWIKKK